MKIRWSVPLGLFVLILPFLEIAGFIIVGGQIGVLPTLSLIVIGMALGGFIIRDAGFSLGPKMMQQLSAGGRPELSLLEATFKLISGLLLIIPGFLTDILGLLLLLSPVQRLVGTLLLSQFDVTATGPTVVDLDAGEFSSQPSESARQAPQITIEAEIYDEKRPKS